MTGVGRAGVGEREGPTVEYDELVVGAGAGGAVVAARLSEDPARRVLLVEAGPDYASLDETPADLRDPWISLEAHDWGLTAMTGDRSIAYPRGRVVGGSTAVNAAVAARGTVEDFDIWVGAGCRQWSYADVLPYYMKLETEAAGDPAFHGRSGPVWIERPPRGEWQPISAAFAESLSSMGHEVLDDHNEPGRTGVGPCSFNIRDGIRMSANATYLAEARGRPNLEIRPGVLVDRVVIEGGVAVGVEVVVDGRRQRLTARRVTLAAGAVGTPAILQRSGVGPEDLLRALGIPVAAASPGVGGNLMDHSGGAVAALARPGSQRDESVYFEMFFRDGPRAMALLTLFDRRPLGQFFGDPAGPPVISMTAGTWRPESRGSIRVISTDPTAAPDIQLNFLTHPSDVRRAIEGVHHGLEVLHSAPMKELVESVISPEPGVAASDDSIAALARATCSTGYHPVGTARMGGDGDADAVCDQHGRVRGIERLRVADASLMPVIVTAPTNLTAIMIGERVADWMKSESD
jgi:choline dehydrogenase-like flavoprotein